MNQPAPAMTETRPDPVSTSATATAAAAAATPAPARHPSRPDGIRPSSRPSAVRAAAAAKLVGLSNKTSESGDALDPERSLDPRRVGEDVRHLRVVQPRKLTAAERRRRARILLAGGMSLLVAVVFGLVYMHVVLAQRQFAIDRINARVQSEQAQYQNLRLQVAQLGSPQNIIATAEGQLGMTQPASVTYLTPKQTLGGSSTPASQATASAQAPAGDADWPLIKSQLAGSP
ncbi:MAG TPA: hypothetical protein VMO88_12400 [Acidimicrobiales bacterium]|nr:hypothetical protein [Acidimicrobiales bacterium]